MSDLKSRFDSKRVTDFLQKGVSDLQSSVKDFREDRFYLSPGKRLLAWGALAIPFMMSPIVSAATLGAMAYMRYTKSNKSGWGLERGASKFAHVMNFVEKGVSAVFQVVHNDEGVNKMPVSPTTRMVAAGVAVGAFMVAPIVTTAVVGTVGVISYTDSKKESAEKTAQPEEKKATIRQP